MEILDAIVYLTVLGVVLSGVLVTIFRLFPQKTAKKAMDKTIVDNNRIINEQIDGIKQRYESELRSKAKKLKDYESAEGLEEENTKEVDFETILAGAKQMGINPTLLMPFKKQILKYTKGMSIEEIGQLAQSAKGLFGNKQSQVDGGEGYGQQGDDSIKYA